MIRNFLPGLAAAVGLGVLAVKNSRKVKQRHGSIISNGPYSIIKNKMLSRVGFLGQPRHLGGGLAGREAGRGKRESEMQEVDVSEILHVSFYYE